MIPLQLDTMVTPALANPAGGARRGIHGPLARALAALLLMLAASGALVPAPVMADPGSTPLGVAQSMVNRAIAIMANKAVPVTQRRRELRAAIESSFDFTEMSRSALGYNWRSITPAQRTEFTQLFTAFIEDAYLSKIQDYSGQQVQFSGQTQLGPGYTQIDSTLVQPGKNAIAINYLLLQKNDSWKIYDVTVDAISIISNYRNQFNRVINEKGFNQLIADLRAKQQQLASQLGGN
ncbi:MAG: ABC transporter substrate-binding protein [Candidatus Binataceae bacterium]|nr:ABC transporter substrate-binding protein [Candidatus Binataceae bacterium]